jgi:hypothetical protein
MRPPPILNPKQSKIYVPLDSASQQKVRVQAQVILFEGGFRDSAPNRYLAKVDLILNRKNRPRMTAIMIMRVVMTFSHPGGPPYVTLKLIRRE